MEFKKKKKKSDLCVMSLLFLLAVNDWSLHHPTGCPTALHVIVYRLTPS